MKAKYLIIPALLASLASCNKDMDERFIPLPDQPGPDQPVNPEQWDFSRHVLFFDFTGQNCVNCPTGHEEMANIQSVYGDAFIPVSIHAGGDTWSMDESQDYGGGVRGLRNPTGEAIASMYGVTNVGPFPCAIVDAHKPLSTRTSEWLTLATQAMQTSATVPLAMKMDCELTDGGVKVSVDAKGAEGQAVAGNIHVWVLESGIVAYQTTGSGMVADYVHNHVFRAAAHGVDGELLAADAGSVAHYDATVSVKPLSGSADNFTVVAFVTTTAGLVQAIEWNPGDQPAPQPVALDYNRHVLFYDFTGQNCVNCPTGHEEMVKIQSVFGDNFLPVSIHAGGDTWSMDENQDYGGGVRGLRNDTGEKIAQSFGVTTVGPFPCAIVDAHKPLSTRTSEWLSMVTEAFQLSKTVNTGMKIECVPGQDKVDVTLTLRSDQALAGNVHFWAIESGIVAYQTTGSGMVNDYVHNHVFRAAAHGAEGEAFDLPADQEAQITATVNVKPLSGSMDNVSIIAFVTTPAGLVQAVEWKK